MLSVATVRYWIDKDKGWRSRWIRWATGSNIAHVTLQVGKYSMHADRKSTGWYPTWRLWSVYKKSGVYEEHSISKVEVDIENLYGFYTIPLQQPTTWSVLWWKYGFGRNPKTCVANVVTLLRSGGITVPDYVVTVPQLKDYLHDYSRLQRARSNR